MLLLCKRTQTKRNTKSNSMAKRSADEANITVEDDNTNKKTASAGWLSKTDEDGHCEIKRSHFVETHPFVFLFEFDDHPGMFLFDDIDEKNKAVSTFNGSSNYPKITLISSEELMIDVFNRASYTELNKINDPEYIYDVAINKFGVIIYPPIERDIFLGSISTTPRASLTTLERHYLEQLTVEYNKK